MKDYFESIALTSQGLETMLRYLPAAPQHNIQ